MDKDLYFENDKEFENYIKGGNYEMSKLIVNTAEEIQSQGIDELTIARVHTEDTGTIYEITLERAHVVETLEQNLKIYENEEDYIGCQKIVDMINHFKNS